MRLFVFFTVKISFIKKNINKDFPVNLNTNTTQIKQHLRILTVKRISHSQTKLTYLKCDTKSLHSLQSNPSGSHFLILFLKSSRLFKFFISIGTICQTLEAKNRIEFGPHLLHLQNF